MSGVAPVPYGFVLGYRIALDCLRDSLWRQAGGTMYLDATIIGLTAVFVKSTGYCCDSVCFLFVFE